MRSNTTWVTCCSIARARRSWSARPTRRTTINASYENYDNRNSLPNSITPRDAITPWLTAGRPTWNPLTGVLTFSHLIRQKMPDGSAGPMPAFDAPQITDSEASNLYDYIASMVKTSWK